MKFFTNRRLNINNIFLLIYTTRSFYLIFSIIDYIIFSTRKLTIVRVITFFSSIFISRIIFLNYSLTFIVKIIMIMKIRFIIFRITISIMKIIEIINILK